jgi:hypothetical protein
MRKGILLKLETAGSKLPRHVPVCPRGSGSVRIVRKGSINGVKGRVDDLPLQKLVQDLSPYGVRPGLNREVRMKRNRFAMQRLIGQSGQCSGLTYS